MFMHGCAAVNVRGVGPILLTTGDFDCQKVAGETLNS